MAIGIGSWTYGWAVGVPGHPRPAAPLGAAGLLSRAREFGVGVVQFADNLPLDALPAGELEFLHRQARASGLSIEIGTRGCGSAVLRRNLELARFFGAAIVRTLPVESSLDAVRERICEVLPEFRDAGVTLALENYEQHSCADLAALVRSFGESTVGVCLDTVNSLGILETPAQVLAELAPHVVNIHVKDFVIRRAPSKMGFLVEGCPAGEGMLDLDAVLEAVRKRGRSPSLILEQWTPFTETVERTVELEEEWARRGVQFLRRYA